MFAINVETLIYYIKNNIIYLKKLEVFLLFAISVVMNIKKNV